MVDSIAYETKASRFDRSFDEENQSWGLRLKSALESRQLAAVVTNDEMDEKQIDVQGQL